MRLIEGAGAWRPPVATANDWVEHLRVADLSVGTYCIPAGGLDDQTPHAEDEIYVVTAGRGTIITPAGSAEVGPGSVIFVPAGEEHRFTQVTEDLALLVVFGPAYGSRSPAAGDDSDRLWDLARSGRLAVIWLPDSPATPEISPARTVRGVGAGGDQA